MIRRPLNVGALSAFVVLVVAACVGGEANVADITTEAGAVTTSPSTTTTENTIDSVIDDSESTLTDDVIEETSTTLNGSGPDLRADHVIEVEVVNGSLVGELVRHEVSMGNSVLIVVSVDVDDEVHVHAYDVYADATPDSPAMAMFTADIPGIFEVELERAGVSLLELEVS